MLETLFVEPNLSIERIALITLRQIQQSIALHMKFGIGLSVYALVLSKYEEMVLGLVCTLPLDSSLYRSGYELTKWRSNIIDG